MQADCILRIKIYTTAAPTGGLTAKLEGGTSAPSEIPLPSITNNAWTEYTFDFSDQANENHTRVIFFINAGATRTNGPETYFLDDIRFDDDGTATDDCAGVTPDPMILNDFECQQNEPFQVCFPIVDNPLVNADNGSGKVGFFTDFGAEFDNIFIQFDGPIDLTTNNQLRLKVNTDVAGTLVARLDGGTSEPIEVPATLAGTGEWEMPTFDFSSQAGTDHTRLVFFFNFNVVPGPDEQYFLDDIVFEAALPVELTTFTATTRKQDAVLEWTTASEIAVADYTVEYATATTNWTAVGSLPVTGDSYTERRYELTHPKLGTGRHLYRLRMNDLDGSVAYSDVVTVDMTAGTGALATTAYPNPFTDVLSIPLTAIVEELIVVELTDQLGRTVIRQEQTISSGQRVVTLTDLGEVAAGSYLLRLVHGDRTQPLSVLRR